MFEVRTGELVAQLGGELLGDAELAVARHRLAGSRRCPRHRLSFQPALSGAAAAVGCRLRDRRPGSARRGGRAAQCDRQRRPLPVLRPAHAVVGSAHAQAARAWACTRARWSNPAPSFTTRPASARWRMSVEGAVIGRGVVIGPQCHVGAHAVIGEHTRLAAQVVIGERCRIGARCILHGGVVIGADGFGFAPLQGRWEKIEQLGAVRHRRRCRDRRQQLRRPRRAATTR